LIAWLNAHNLTVNDAIPDEGKSFSVRINGKIVYKYAPVKEILEMPNKFYCLENGEYTIGAIDNKNGIEYIPNINDPDFVKLDYFNVSKKIDSGEYFLSDEEVSHD
jgi:hypothetical protein